MNIDAFWKLIAATRRAAHGDSQDQSQRLRAALAATTAETILAFDSICYDLLDRAYRADLWEAAYVIEGGCSDDGFDEFREWLIARGKTVYEKALANPESLAAVIEVEDVSDLYFPLLGVAPAAYEQLTGKKLSRRVRAPYKLQGELHAEELIPDRFPRLAAKFLEM